MTKYEIIEKQIERRTYIKGKFQGKFIGYFDPKKSDIFHENFYDLEVISGEIKTFKDNYHIRHWETGEPEEFQSVEKFQTVLPENLPVEIRYENGNPKIFIVNLKEKKLSNVQIANQIYENNKVFGDIYGDISGYIKHFDVELEYIKVENEEVPISEKKKKTSRQTGNFQTSGLYNRWEYYYSDGSTYWGEWVKQITNVSSYSIWEFLAILIYSLVIIAIVIPLIIYGWQIIFPIFIVIGIFLILGLIGNIIVNLFKWLFRIVGIISVFFLILGIISFLTSTLKSPTVKRNIETENEISETNPTPFVEDSIISHHRIWQDYSNNEYSGDIRVRISDYQNSTIHRNDLPIPLQTTSNYNRIINNLSDYDKNKLDLIYSMLEKLKVENNLNQMEFAELIVTLIQNIPYTLILPNNCDAQIYNDDFIIEYLSSGGKCKGNIKYGLLSPIEFMASLAGDCDTRTLLLFTILNHYSYDVAMLSSELYKHSILGINLPYNGISKSINGKKYVVWETTAQGLPPGIISREISDMRFWNVSMLSN